MAPSAITTSLAQLTIALIVGAAGIEAEIELPVMGRITSELYAKTSRQESLSHYHWDEYYNARQNQTTIRLWNEASSKSYVYYKMNDPKRRYTVTRYNVSSMRCTNEHLDQALIRHLHRLLMLVHSDYKSSPTTRISLTSVGILGLIGMINKIASLLVMESSGEFDELRFTHTNYYVYHFQVPHEIVEDFLNEDLEFGKQKLLKLTVATATQRDQNKARLRSKLSTTNQVPLSISLVLVDRGSAEHQGIMDTRLMRRLLDEGQFMGALVQIYSLTALDLTRASHDLSPFTRPFTLPLGVGCWQASKEVPLVMGQNHPDGLQFSGEFVWRQERQFVAYDSASGSLRVDRYHNRSVYDLRERRIYHFSPDTGCAVVDGANQYDTPESVIGFGPTRPLYRMGTTTVSTSQEDVEHHDTGQEYEVYEVALDNGRAPMIFGHHQLSERQEHYLIVYVSTTRGGSQDNIARAYLRWRIRKMELRSFDSTFKISLQRELITFQTWWWSLEELNAPRSPSVNVFDVDECSLMQQSHLRLHLLMELAPGPGPGPHNLPGPLEEAAIEWLSSSLNVARARITQLEARVHHQSVAMSANLLDVPERTSTRQFRGYLGSSWALEKLVALVRMSRMLQVDCFVEAATRHGVGYVAYCKDYGHCILLPEATYFGKDLHQGNEEDQDHPDQEDPRECAVYSVGPATRDNQNVGGSLRQVEESANKLNGTSWTLMGGLGHPETPVQIVGIWTWSNRETIEAFHGLGYVGQCTNGSTNFGHYLVGQFEAPNRQSHLYCRSACQMTPRCWSYSFCRLAHRNECTLTGLDVGNETVIRTLREIWSQSRPITSIYCASDTTHETLVPLGAGSDNHRRLDNAVSVEVASEHRVLISRNNRCQINEKDMLDFYQEDPLYRWTRMKASQIEHTIKSRRECLRSCYRQGCKQVHYCPNWSLCIYRGQKGANKQNYLMPMSHKHQSQEEEPQLCHGYHRNYAQYYGRQFDTRMVPLDDGTAIIETVTGTTEHECGQLCLDGGTQCLAYDHCHEENEGHNYSVATCTLYSVASPISGNGPLADGPNGTARLADSHQCTHYYLTGLNLQIRRQLGSSEFGSNPSTTTASTTTTNTSSTTKASDSSTYGTQTETGREPGSRDRESREHETQPGGGAWVQFMVGVLMGAMILLAGPKLCTTTIEFITRLLRLREATKREDSHQISFVPLGLDRLGDHETSIRRENSTIQNSCN